MRITMLASFFFQAEDGIRHVAVTGVQTCALPIYARQGGAVRRVSVRLRQADGGRGGAARTDDRRAGPAARQLPRLVLPHALGVAARGRGRRGVERPGYAAVHVERGGPRPVAPQDRAGRHAVRLHHEQLLAHELRGAAGRRVHLSFPDLAARGGGRRRATLYTAGGGRLTIEP